MCTCNGSSCAGKENAPRRFARLWPDELLPIEAAHDLGFTARIQSVEEAVEVLVQGWRMREPEQLTGVTVCL